MKAGFARVGTSIAKVQSRLSGLLMQGVFPLMIALIFALFLRH